MLLGKQTNTQPAGLVLCTHTIGKSPAVVCIVGADTSCGLGRGVIGAVFLEDSWVTRSISNLPVKSVTGRRGKLLQLGGKTLNFTLLINT